MNAPQTRFEQANPILRVADMARAVRYYVDVLGFEQASWGDDHFGCVSRDGACIYLARGEQGHTGSWVWIGVSDAEEVHAELQARGARIRHGPTNYSWALEVRVEDPDGNVLRLGSDAKTDRPYQPWKP